MNYQKMSKTALIKRCKALEAYIYDRRDALEFKSLRATNPVLDDSFMQFRHIRTQRQLGIVQGINFMCELDYTHGVYWDRAKSPPSRHDLYQIRKAKIQELKELWEEE